MNRTGIVPPIILFLAAIAAMVLAPTLVGQTALGQESESNIPKVIIRPDSTTSSSGVLINLKAIKEPNNQLKKVNLDIEASNVVVAKDTFSVLVDRGIEVLKAKIRTDISIKNLVELPQLVSGLFSLEGVKPGVYILDVILQQGSKQLAYETILVVIDKPAAPEQYNSIINNFKHYSVVNNFINKIKIENDIQTKIPVFESEKQQTGGSGGGDGGGGCSNEEGSAVMGYPYQKITQCQVEEFEECERTGEDSARCETAEERFSDDCEGFANQEECDEAWSDPDPDPEGVDLPTCDGSFQNCEQESGTNCEAGTNDDSCTLEGEHCGIEGDGECHNYFDGVCTDCGDQETEIEEEEDDELEDGPATTLTVEEPQDEEDGQDVSGDDFNDMPAPKDAPVTTESTTVTVEEPQDGEDEENDNFEDRDGDREVDWTEEDQDPSTPELEQDDGYTEEEEFAEIDEDEEDNEEDSELEPEIEEEEV
jgi:hypothetical protein